MCIKLCINTLETSIKTIWCCLFSLCVPKHAGTHFELVAAGATRPVVFSSGTMTTTISIVIIDDSEFEGPEYMYFQVMLRVNNLFAVKPVGVIIILDDDTRKLGRVGGMEGEYGGRWEGVKKVHPKSRYNAPWNVV